MTGLAVTAALVVLAACAALILYTKDAVDQISQARETRLMERAIERRFSRLEDDLASVAIWTDAYNFTARAYDAEWADVNYGVYFSEYLHHDLTVVFDADDRPIYASKDGETVAAAALAPFIQSVRPMLAVARARAERKISAQPEVRGFDRQGSIQAATEAGETIYLVGVSTIVPESEDTQPLLPTRDPVVVSGVIVDDEFLKSLDVDYGLRRARLMSGPAEPQAKLRGADGRELATVTWAPEQPGQGVLERAWGWILVIGLVVAVSVSLLLFRVRQLTEEMMRARDLAQAGEQAKADFVSNISHEIRTPLNGVLGMAQVMEANDLPADQRQRLKIIRESGAVLLDLLNDVLDLSKIDAGKVELERAPFRPDEVGRAVCAAFQAMASEKGVNLRFEADVAANLVRQGDPLRVRQIISNLVSNAVKFTEQGEVTLSVTVTGGLVTYMVADTGVGLAPEQLPQLFEKFSQADTSTTRRFGGTGLGLSICAGLVELMGGGIEVTSAVGEGATFTVELPLPHVAGEVSHSPPSEDVTVAPASYLSGLKVLAAEDNAVNLMVLRALLQPLDIELTAASDGAEAVAAFEHGAFDLILMDIQMPGMNGVDATRAIRRVEAARGGNRTPIIALSANVMEHQLAEYRAVGMDGHVAKPLDAAALYEAIGTKLSEVRAAA